MHVYGYFCLTPSQGHKVSVTSVTIKNQLFVPINIWRGILTVSYKGHSRAKNSYDVT